MVFKLLLGASRAEQMLPGPEGYEKGTDDRSGALTRPWRLTPLVAGPTARARSNSYLRGRFPCTFTRADRQTEAVS